MKAAMDAVRWLRGSIVKSGNGSTAFEKRAFLRHFADIAAPVCEIRVQLRGVVDVRSCTHDHCPWAFVQADWQLSNELSACPSKIIRVRDSLAADGWITIAQVVADGVVLCLLDKKKLQNSRAPVPNFEPAKCIHVTPPGRPWEQVSE